MPSWIKYFLRVGLLTTSNEPKQKAKTTWTYICSEWKPHGPKKQVISLIAPWNRCLPAHTQEGSPTKLLRTEQEQMSTGFKPPHLSPRMQLQCLNRGLTCSTTKIKHRCKRTIEDIQYLICTRETNVQNYILRGCAHNLSEVVHISLGLTTLEHCTEDEDSVSGSHYQQTAKLLQGMEKIPPWNPQENKIHGSKGSQKPAPRARWATEETGTMSRYHIR